MVPHCVFVVMFVAYYEFVVTCLLRVCYVSLPVFTQNQPPTLGLNVFRGEPRDASGIGCHEHFADQEGKLSNTV